MSRAGKFIPGGARRTGPIRAPEPGEVPQGGASTGKKTPGKGLGLIRPVSKAQRLPIVITSATVCCMLFIAAYYFAYLPEVRKEQAAEQQARDEQQKLA